MVGPVSWDKGGPPCTGSVGSTGDSVVVGPVPGSALGPATGLEVGEGGGDEREGSKELPLSFDILPKENNGFTRIMFYLYCVFS